MWTMSPPVCTWHPVPALVLALVPVPVPVPVCRFLCCSIVCVLGLVYRKKRGPLSMFHVCETREVRREIDPSLSWQLASLIRYPSILDSLHSLFLSPSPSPSVRLVWPVRSPCAGVARGVRSGVRWRCPVLARSCYTPPALLEPLISSFRGLSGSRMGGWLLGVLGTRQRHSGRRRRKTSPRRLYMKCAGAHQARHMARQDGAIAIITRRRQYVARSLKVSVLSIERRCWSLVWHRKKVRCIGFLL